MARKYPLASLTRRFFARALDLFFIAIILVGLFFIIFGIENIATNFKSSHFLIYVILIAIIALIYFVLIPFLTRGRTLFMWALNIRVFNIIFTNYRFFNNKETIPKDLFRIFLSFVKRELPVWIILAIINLILGIVVFFLGEQEGLIFIKSIFLANLRIYPEEDFNAYAIIFTSLYSINFIIALIVFLNFFASSGKRNMVDVYSDTVTLFMKESGPSNKNINKKVSSNKNYGLPMEILDTVFDELDDLGEKDGA
ncbi:MAG: RDD family protein [Mycoplasmoidaceae bacterium]